MNFPGKRILKICTHLYLVSMFYFQAMKTMVQFAEGKYQGEKTVVLKLPKPINKTAYDKGMYVDVTKQICLKGFRWRPPGIHPIKKKREKDSCMYLYWKLLQRVAGCINFEGNAVGIAIVSGPDAGIIEYRIDNGRTATLNLFTPGAILCISHGTSC